ncbi:hypothetical protein APHAL10511_000218 [Amanita phalloides]|nr:hypothetical protein APHAL10511_000218 [Amanita phalloides]
MVTIAPAPAQTHDSDRRKKHSFERARVVHLTRQLQLRLQYAKLKVEHGWQRQNLNEVENLYFHLSHSLRGSNPQPLLSTAVVHDSDYGSASTSPDPSTEPEKACQDFRRDTAETVNWNHTKTPSVAAQRDDSSTHVDAASRPPTERSATINGAPTPQQPNAQQHVPSSNSTLFSNLSNRDEKGTLSHPTFPSDTSAPSIISNTTYNSYHPPSSTGSALTNSPNMALTYDSFWSNHNSTRPFRSSFFNSSDMETNRIAAQALLSGLPAKNITSYLGAVSADFITASPSVTGDIISTARAAIRRPMPVTAAVVQGVKDR